MHRPLFELSFNLLRKVDDVFETIHVTVFDDHKKEAVGRVCIPLQKVTALPL